MLEDLRISINARRFNLHHGTCIVNDPKHQFLPRLMFNVYKASRTRLRMLIVDVLRLNEIDIV